MENTAELIALAKECGFTHAAALDVSTLHVMQDVRDMCAVNTCGMYDKRWSCPPGCGSLEECAARIARYKGGIIVQTVGQLEDSFDIEGMQEAEQNQKKAFSALLEELRRRYPDLLPLGTGCCKQCGKCTYPDEPCRFPDKAMSSMEAYGLMVNQVCLDNALHYNYGPNTIAYTGCFLLV